MDKTERGFDYSEFEDLYGNKGHIQKSSLATEDAIWLGIPNPRISVGPPWKDITLPEDHLIHSSMHLNRQQVEEMLPYLVNFVETGELE